MKIKEMFPKRNKVKLVQARIDEKLVEQVRSKLKKDQVTLQEFFEAAFKSYLQE